MVSVALSHSMTSQLERHRVVTLLELDVSIPVHFNLGPGCQLWWHIGQGSELQQETVDRRITTGVTMIASYPRVNGGALDACCTPFRNLLAP